ncbi:hypothetical protein WICMUC_000962 [Wickerhamomyces mucosus]|uniref:White-opaque regulator 3 n=1 Tax=Wickerhamomyces mucosus TaxID=1378264 RepID=A0A9P8PW04_9ASCO|nr:hypothetical protein WICMUC_000962 [Wickerhamomyces mucosus]
MDSHNAAVITAALEQQAKDEADINVKSERYTQQEQQHQQQHHQQQQRLDLNNLVQGANQIEQEFQQRLIDQPPLQNVIHQSQGNDSQINSKKQSILPRSSTHKSFAVDPRLNVGVGVITDIVAPRTNHEEPPNIHHHNSDSNISDCSRCKKEFAIDPSGKIFKLCPHCRELQRERSRKWQQKTKLKDGACRRCGIQIPEDHSKFVLCPPCRLNLRTRKASRYENGKCVHCSGPNESTDYKVCQRCRTNDRLRRKTLEEKGCCNRCAQKLDGEDSNHKVCHSCRSRKKSVSKIQNSTNTAVAAVVHATNAIPDQLEDNSYQHQHQQPQQQQYGQPQQPQQYNQSQPQTLEANLFAQ